MTDTVYIWIGSRKDGIKNLSLQTVRSSSRLLTFFIELHLSLVQLTATVFYWEWDMITWCVFFFHDSLIVFSFWLLLLHSGLFHYLINWLGGEQTVPQRILLKDCCFFFPLSRIRRYQHTVMNTSLNLVAKFLTTVDLRSETCKEGRYTMISLELQEIFFGGTTRNRKGLQSDFRAKCSGEATHWPLARVGKLWQEVTALLSFERCSIIHFPFSSPFLPPFTPWLSHPLPATSPPSAAGPEATLPVIAVALLSVLPFLIYEFCAVKKPPGIAL